MRLEPLYRATFTPTERWSVELAGAHGVEGQGFLLVEGRSEGRLSGRLRAANYPRRRTDGTQTPDFRGVLETDDGATVLFAWHGYGRAVDGGRVPAGGEHDPPERRRPLPLAERRPSACSPGRCGRTRTAPGSAWPWRWPSSSGSPPADQPGCPGPDRARNGAAGRCRERDRGRRSLSAATIPWRTRDGTDPRSPRAHQEVQDHRGPGRARPHRRTGPGHGRPRSQRGGQDHVHPHGGHPPPARRRHPHRRRHRRPGRAGQGPPGHRPGRPVGGGGGGHVGTGEPRARRPPVRPRSQAGQGQRPGRARAAGPHRRRRPPGAHLLRRHAPQARRGRQPGRRPRAAPARRAHHRPRPPQPQRAVGHHPRPGGVGHRRPAHHPVPRRGRPAGLPHRHHRPRQGHRRGDGRPPQVPGRGRRHPGPRHGPGRPRPHRRRPRRPSAPSDPGSTSPPAPSPSPPSRARSGCWRRSGPSTPSASRWPTSACAGPPSTRCSSNSPAVPRKPIPTPAPRGRTRPRAASAAAAPPEPGGETQ